LWLLGCPDQALKRGDEALRLAQELAHPFSLAYALTIVSVVHRLRREEKLTQERAEASLTLSTEQGFTLWSALGTMLRGWALAVQGQEEGIVQMGQGLTASKATGTELARPYYLGLLAEAHGKAGQTEEGLQVLAEAQALVDKTGERVYEAELYQLKGQLTLQQLSVVSYQPPISNP
jgi:predicted ATPase